MLTTYTFWTHGVNTIVQRLPAGIDITHSGGGTQVKMPVKAPNTTENFLHIPIPTPTALELSSIFPVEPALVTCVTGHLRATVNDHVLIKSVQFLVDGVSKFSSGSVSVPASGKIDEPVPCNDFVVTGGLVLSLTVDFLAGAPGIITILGAGATFKVVATV